MSDLGQPLSTSILAIMYFGDVVFAVSGALTAAQRRLDIMGFVLIGTITGIGGGTIRDLLLGRTVWWTENPFELVLCAGAAFLTFFLIKSDITRRKGMVWSDALGLAAFAVVGCHIALEFGSPTVIAVFMGMVTATGGGVLRDVLTNTHPMSISCGQPYATAALVGALGYAGLVRLSLPGGVAELLAFLAAFSLRAAAIKFDIRMGPPGEFIRIAKSADDK
jgi:uncharacterized membrane protein YeiH